MHATAISIAIRCCFPSSSCSLFFFFPPCSCSLMIGWQLHLRICFFPSFFYLPCSGPVGDYLPAMWDGKHSFVLLGHWISCDFFNPLPYPELVLLIFYQASNGKRFSWMLWLLMDIQNRRFNLFKLARFPQVWLPFQNSLWPSWWVVELFLFLLFCSYNWSTGLDEILELEP